MLELKRHRALSAHVAAVLDKSVAHLGHGTRLVVSHAVNDDGGSANAVTFVTHLFVLNAFKAAGSFGDAVLDIFKRHVGRLAFFNRQAQARVGGGVTAAEPSRNHDLSHHPSPDALAFFVLPAFAVLDICPFTVTCHGDP